MNALNAVSEREGLGWVWELRSVGVARTVSAEIHRAAGLDQAESFRWVWTR
jgi:hypothetical protein